MPHVRCCRVSCLASGHFDLPEGIVISVPVTFKGGEWSVFKDVTVKGELEERLQLLASEIEEVPQCHKAPKSHLDVSHLKEAYVLLYFFSFHRKKNLHLKK